MSMTTHGLPTITTCTRCHHDAVGTVVIDNDSQLLALIGLHPTTAGMLCSTCWERYHLDTIFAGDDATTASVVSSPPQPLIDYADPPRLNPIVTPCYQPSVTSAEINSNGTTAHIHNVTSITDYRRSRRYGWQK